jgi:hypothetical protein
VRHCERGRRGGGGGGEAEREEEREEAAQGVRGRGRKRPTYNGVVARGAAVRWRWVREVECGANALLRFVGIFLFVAFFNIILRNKSDQKNFHQPLFESC